MFPLEKRGVSLYLLISEYILKKIKENQWPEGSKLPAEPDLAKEFQVSRFTIRQALAELISKGYLIRKRGQGTFVSSPTYEGDFVRSFYPSDLGSLHKLISIKHIASTPFLEKKLNIPVNEIVTELYRSRFIQNDNVPTILEKTYFSSKLLPDIEKMDMSSRLYGYIINVYGIPLVRAKSIIEPVMPEKFESEILQCPMTQPLLMVTRICYTTDEKPVVLTKSLIKTNKCKLSMEDEM